MTALDLEAIRRRVEAATAAPNSWDAGVQETTNLNWHDHVLVPAIGKPYRFRPADVALFAHAPADIRALLAEVERLQIEREQLLLAAIAAHDVLETVEVRLTRDERLRWDSAKARLRSAVNLVGPDGRAALGGAP